MDGLKNLLRKAGDEFVQRMLLNDWKHDHNITKVLVFALDGTLIFAAINFPESMHDSSIA